MKSVKKERKIKKESGFGRVKERMTILERNATIRYEK
jgi:hypothetical protein